MKRKRLLLALGITTGVLAAELVLNHYFALPTEAPRISSQVDVGYRIAFFDFMDAERSTEREDGLRGGFAPGISTYRLEERQRHRPLLYVRQAVGRRTSVEWTYERLEGITRTRDVYTLEPYDHSNGRVILDGPSLTKYESDVPLFDFSRLHWSTIMPYTGTGEVAFTGRFRHDPWWGGDGVRRMEVDDAEGELVTRSVAFRLTPRWTLDVSWGILKVAPTSRYWMRPEPRPRVEWQYPMDCRIWKIGIRRRVFPWQRARTDHPGRWIPREYD